MAMIADWCKIGAEEVAAASASPAVQTAEEMRRKTPGRLPQLHEAAGRLYATWTAGLR
jgi:hypothetical protein